MLTKDFWYELPPERIAQAPAKPRDSSRLMVLEPATRRIQEARFFELPDFLRPGDLLVANDSKVFRARLHSIKTTIRHPELVSGSQANQPEMPNPVRHDEKTTFEIFLLRPEGDVWIALAKPGRKLAVGDTLDFTSDVSATVAEKMDDGTVKLSFGLTVDEVFSFTDAHGEVPTPPYVERAPTDPEDYQTVYASRVGSAAAPTAGFHFTPELIEKLKAKGIEFATVTLHVGLGTFRPMKTENVEDHVMHEEWIDVPNETMAAIKRTKKQGGRVIAVGTTTVRALESDTQHGFTKIFITPGFAFKKIDALITNFHLPESTLLVLVSAFAQTKMQEPDAGRKFMLDAYGQAIADGYRFFSFGDAMFIH